MPEKNGSYHDAERAGKEGVGFFDDHYPDGWGDRDRPEVGERQAYMEVVRPKVWGQPELELALLWTWDAPQRGVRAPPRSSRTAP